ncbi:hypothetical protein C0991_007975 [Blastosporella zonata]|nr:hypothetical protein C0991_007975 [Blastosporella zonata]
MASPVEPESEYTQSVTTSFEWTIRGLKNLFDSSKGDGKSKTTKSMRFGSGRWQILFYANAGTASKEGTSGTSEGGGYVSLYLSCEPTQEEKDVAAVDGGKAQFAKRDLVYYTANSIKNQDAFVIICTITSSPAPPSPPPAYRTQSVPKRLLETVGALLDDPLYSDVEFIIPGRRGDIKSARKILASRTLLKRAEYFGSMFESGFAEGSLDQLQPAVKGTQSAPSVMDSEAHLVMNEFEDSDDDEDEAESAASQPGPEPSSRHVSPPSEAIAIAAPVPDSSQEDDYEVDEEDGERNVRAKLSHPSSPRTNHESLPSTVPAARLSVVVKDVAYTTYKALLYYLYTDTVVFAPLSSSFLSKTQPIVDSTPQKARSPSPSEESSTQKNSSEETPISRRQWIQEWKEDHLDRPSPCSAKAMYRLADRLDLPILKARASQHIVKSLTVDNIAYEIFTPFAAAFNDIRKVQVDFFLAHWKDIRASDSMRCVWQQIRNGRHPGFEEVWPVIASNLEFQPTPKKTTKGAEAAGDVSR